MRVGILNKRLWRREKKTATGDRRNLLKGTVTALVIKQGALLFAKTW
jgi:hypothetical protein